MAPTVKGRRCVSKTPTIPSNSGVRPLPGNRTMAVLMRSRSERFIRPHGFSDNAKLIEYRRVTVCLVVLLACELLYWTHGSTVPHQGDVQCAVGMITFGVLTMDEAYYYTGSLSEISA